MRLNIGVWGFFLAIFLTDTPDFLWFPRSLADVSGIVGLAVSVFGFIYTWVSVDRSKKAAERAEQAAKKAVNSVKLFDTVADFAAAASVMEEIKRLHRQNAWHIILDRYSALKRLLIDVKESNGGLCIDHRSELQSAIQNITDMENKVEQVLRKGKVPDSPKLNEAISYDLNKVHEILVALKLQARS